MRSRIRPIRWRRLCILCPIPYPILIIRQIEQPRTNNILNYIFVLALALALSTSASNCGLCRNVAPHDDNFGAKREGKVFFFFFLPICDDCNVLNIFSIHKQTYGWLLIIDSSFALLHSHIRSLAIQFELILLCISVFWFVCIATNIPTREFNKQQPDDDGMVVTNAIHGWMNELCVWQLVLLFACAACHSRYYIMSMRSEWYLS